MAAKPQTPTVPKFLVLGYNKSLERDWVAKVQKGRAAAKITNPSPEQAAILNAACNTQDSILMEARAGAGKTTQLFAVLDVLNLWPRIETKPDWKTKEPVPYSPEISTMHAFLRGCWREAKGATILDSGKKLWTLARDIELTQDPVYRAEKGNHLPAIIQAVNGARQWGITPGDVGSPLREDTDAEWQEMMEALECMIPRQFVRLARSLLRASIEAARRPMARKSGTRSFRNAVELDFQDHLYMPVCFGAAIPPLSHVFIDEVQDLDPLMIAAMGKIAGPTARVIASGDPKQSIYQFRGADGSAVEKLIAQHNLKRFPLTVSWRCAQAVIRSANELVPDIRARPGAPEGSVLWLGETDRITLEELPDATLCAHNAPVLSLAAAAFISGIPVRVQAKSGHFAELESLHALLYPDQTVSMYDYEERALLHLLDLVEKGTDPSKTLQDNIAALVAVGKRMPKGTKAAELPVLLKRLYYNTNARAKVFGTIHSMKGLEYESVGIVEHHLIRKYVNGDYGVQEANNLDYVARTRAKKTLVIFGLGNVEGYATMLKDLPDFSLNIELAKAARKERQRLARLAKQNATP